MSSHEPAASATSAQSNRTGIPVDLLSERGEIQRRMKHLSEQCGWKLNNLTLNRINGRPMGDSTSHRVNVLNVHLKNLHQTFFEAIECLKHVGADFGFSVRQRIPSLYLLENGREESFPDIEWRYVRPLLYALGEEKRIEEHARLHPSHVDLLWMLVQHPRIVADQMQPKDERYLTLPPLVAPRYATSDKGPRKVVLINWNRDDARVEVTASTVGNLPALTAVSFAGTTPWGNGR